jgi:hypothetical protein
MRLSNSSMNVEVSYHPWFITVQGVCRDDFEGISERSGGLDLVLVLDLDGFGLDRGVAG